MSKRLYNGLIDSFVIIGNDQDTGLRTKLCSLETNDIYLSSVQPCVLANITHDQALYPHKQIKQSLFYPPLKIVKLTSLESSESLDDSDDKQCLHDKKLYRRNTIKSFEKSLASEVLENMPEFCFPEPVSVQRKQTEPCLHSFVLTDLDGNRTFAMVLTYYREFYCCTEFDHDSTYQLVKIDEEDDVTEESKDYLVVYVPTALLVISNYSYHNLFKDYLSQIYLSLNESPSNFESIIERYAYQMSSLPVPPCSTQRFALSLEYNFDDFKIILSPEEDQGNNVFDLNLSFIFMRFTLDELLKVIQAIFSEQKIVFISACYTFLTPVIECFFKLIYPFKWQHVYVPVRILPSTKIDFVEAPNPFIMGCNSKYRKQIEPNNDVIIADIDQGSVFMPENVNVNEFPADLWLDLKQSLRQIDFNLLETTKLMSITSKSIDFYRQMDRDINKTLNTQISKVFLQFYVNMFGDVYSSAFIQSNGNFNKKKFIESKREEYRIFYEQVLKTHLFDLFISERIENYKNQINDVYYKMVEQMLHSNVKIKPLKKSPSPNSSQDLFKNANKTLNTILKMPAWSETKNYAHLCIESLSQELKHSHPLLFSDSLKYVRGLLLISIGKFIEGFSDLYSIESSQLFPMNLLQTKVYPGLSESQKEQICEQKFYREACESHRFDKDDFETSFHSSIDAFKSELNVRFKDLNFSEFCERLDQLDFRMDSATSKRLFDALTMQETSELDLQTFELFVEYWMIKEEELNRCKKYLPKSKFRGKEFALRISNQSVKTNQGIGRLILTQKCLYYLEHGTNKRKTLVEVRNIIDMEKFENCSQCSTSVQPALKVFTSIKESEPLILCLGDELSVWFIILKELFSGICLAELKNDSSIVQYAAKNVLLISALNASCHDADLSTPYSRDFETAAKMLSYFTEISADKDGSLSHNTNEILHLRINPSVRELVKFTVESMIYYEYDDEICTLWCAVGNRIKIFDTETWTYETADVKLREKITCMICIKSCSKIWIGTVDKCLYVIDIQTKTIDTKIVMAHNDVISDLLLYKESLISASINGELIVWSPKTTQKLDSINLSDILSEFKSNLLSVQSFRDNFIYTTMDHIFILDENFKHLKTLTLESNEKDKILPISCSCISHIDDSTLIWVACATYGFIWIWSLDDFELRMRLAVDDQLGLRVMTFACNKIWIGSKDGKLNAFSVRNFEREHTVDRAHKDSIRSFCLIENKFLVTGSGSKDGSIAVWQLNTSSRLKTINQTMERILERDSSKMSSRRISSLNNRRRSAGLPKTL